MGLSVLPKHNKVTSVNGATGDVIINRVSLADNLYSPDNREMYGEYIFRTSGGTADINSGDAELLFINGHTIAQGRIPASATAVSSGGSTPSVDVEAFAASALGANSGTYVFTNVTHWLYNDTPVNLASYGITVTGDPANGNTISVDYTYDDSDPLATASTSGSISAVVDPSTFAQSSLGGSSGIYTFVCESYWAYNWSTVALGDYGISYPGTPINGETITVTYQAFVRGSLVTAKPTHFRSIGLNQFDKNNNILSGYNIDSSGEIVVASGYYVAYVHAVGRLSQGYTAYASDNSIIRVGYIDNIPSAGDSVDILSENSGLNTGLLFSNDGYLCIATTNPETLCVHPTWSGYEDTTYESYSESVITIPTVDANNNSLPTADYGIPSVGGVYDTLSLTALTYTKRIGHYPYSAENLAIVEALETEYDYDSSHIFYVLDTPVVYTLASSVIDTYVVADFGIEEFLGTSVTSFAQNLYGDNLRDKLRRLNVDYKIYASVTDLGLTVGSATITNAVTALIASAPARLFCKSSDFANAEVPNRYGEVEIVALAANRVAIWFYGQTSTYPDRRMYLSNGAPTGTWVKYRSELDEKYTMYDSVDDIGLTNGSATISGAYAALPDRSILMTYADQFASGQVSGTLVIMIKRTPAAGVILGLARGGNVYHQPLNSDNKPTGTWTRFTETSDFVTEEKTGSTGSISAASAKAGSITITKSGYTPIAIAGFTTGNTWLVVTQMYISNSTTLNYTVRNVSPSSSGSGTVSVKVLYRKN